MKHKHIPKDLGVETSPPLDSSGVSDFILTPCCPAKENLILLLLLFLLTNVYNLLLCYLFIINIYPTWIYFLIPIYQFLIIIIIWNTNYQFLLIFFWSYLLRTAGEEPIIVEG